MSITNYIKGNLFQGMRTSPFKASRRSFYFLPLFIAFSLITGFSSGVLEYKPLKSDIVVYLPLSLLVFPSVIEEVLFRGLLIPIDAAEKGIKAKVYYVLLSTSLFVVWHPINAIINPVSAIFFYNPYFLSIVAFLGVTCGTSYIYSKSLWVPILIHWITVLIWVLLLGGRNLILD